MLGRALGKRKPKEWKEKKPLGGRGRGSGSCRENENSFQCLYNINEATLRRQSEWVQDKRMWLRGGRTLITSSKRAEPFRPEVGTRGGIWKCPAERRRAKVESQEAGASSSSGFSWDTSTSTTTSEQSPTARRQNESTCPMQLQSFNWMHSHTHSHTRNWQTHIK